MNSSSFQFLSNKYVKITLFIIVVLSAFFVSFRKVPFSSVPENGYDEQMWTSSAIASYNMFFNDYIRPTSALDNWLPTYAWENSLDIFTGETWSTFAPDTIHFPYDYITIKEPTQQYSLLVKYDTLKFPREEFQWFDKEMWTFGWKAPNMGKYIMGWYIDKFASTKPNPRGYFEFFVPKSLNDSIDKSYVPSTQKSPAPYSYAPTEYQLLARYPSAFFNSLIIIIVFLIGWLFVQYWAGFIASIWLLFNDTFNSVNCLVGLDSFSTFFATLALLTLLLQIKSWQKNNPLWKQILWAVATALASGFAVSSKLNSGMVIIIEIIVFGSLVLNSILNGFKLKNLDLTAKLKPALKIATGGLIAGILAMGIFVYLNPQVQQSPLKNIKVMRESIDEYFSRRARIFISNQMTDRVKAANAFIMKIGSQPNANHAQLQSINNRFLALNQEYINNLKMPQVALNEDKFHLTKSDKYFERLEKIEHDLEKAYPEFIANKKFFNWVKIKNSWPSAFALVSKRIAVVDPQSDRYYGTFGHFLPFKYNGLDGLFGILGLIFSLILCWKYWTDKKELSYYFVLIVSFGLLFYGNVDFVWQDWPRYMTPIFPVYSLMIAIGMIETTRFVIEKVFNKKITPNRVTHNVVHVK